MSGATLRPLPRRLAACAAVAAFAVAAVAGCFSEHEPTGPAAAAECRVPFDQSTIGATVVFIRDFAFHPQTVTVPAGGRVVWVNCEDPDDDSHTSTSDGSQWDSGLLAAGMTYSRIFGESGSFPYHCEPHPSMTGTVTVR